MSNQTQPSEQRILFKVRLVKHDGANWYGDTEIGNEYQVVRINERTYTIETDDPYSTGLDKSHCEIISGIPQKQILTQEDEKRIQKMMNPLSNGLTVKVMQKLFPEYLRLQESERSLLSANAELSFQKNRYKKALSKIVCLNIPMPDEVFNIANDALEVKK